MPMTDDRSLEEKAETLARAAAERAAELAVETAAKARGLADVAAEKAQEIAVARAVKDTIIDRDLREHSEHLNAINGSQREMATSLAGLQDDLKTVVTAGETQAAVSAALTDAVEHQLARRFSRRTQIIGGIAALGAYLALFGLILGH
jgi:hypothetical protein